jgi:hypothetical protein
VEKTRTLIAGLTLLLLAACAGSAVQTATFGTLAEARAAGAVERGWVPAILPEAAYELRAAYAPDGTRRWGLFNFPAEHAEALRAVLHPDEVSVAGTEMDIPARIEWWPVLLRGDLDAERIRTTGLRAYRARSAPLIVAVNWDQGRAYYWTE